MLHMHALGFDPEFLKTYVTSSYTKVPVLNISTERHHVPATPPACEQSAPRSDLRVGEGINSCYMYIGLAKASR